MGRYILCRFHFLLVSFVICEIKLHFMTGRHWKARRTR